MRKVHARKITNVIRCYHSERRTSDEMRFRTRCMVTSGEETDFITTILHTASDQPDLLPSQTFSRRYFHLNEDSQNDEVVVVSRDRDGDEKTVIGTRVRGCINVFGEITLPAERYF